MGQLPEIFVNGRFFEAKTHFAGYKRLLLRLQPTQNVAKWQAALTGDYKCSRVGLF